MRIIAGSHKNRSIKTPRGLTTRPTSNKLREAVFNITQHTIEGAHFLDLFAGSGAMGLEALSRGAAKVTFVEQDRECIRCIRENLKKMELEAIVISGDVIRFLERSQQHYDIIYADPPYGLELGLQALRLVDEKKLGDHLLIEESVASHLDNAEVENYVFEKQRPFGRSTLYEWRVIDA